MKDQCRKIRGITNLLTTINKINKLLTQIKAINRLLKNNLN